MASKRELEERIYNLQKQFNRYQGKIHSLENEVFYKDKEKYWAENQEPDYLQVGDQWRDEEGNEYVLTSVGAPKNDGTYTCDFYAIIINKETGEHIGRHVTWFPNNDIYSLRNDNDTLYNLSITDNMIKIK